jgi:hypothetical protein
MLAALLLVLVNLSSSEIGNQLLSFFYCCVLTPLGLLSSTWLVWIKRTWLAHTFVWIIFQLIFIMSMSLDSLPFLGLFFTNLQMLLFPLLLFVNFLYAHQKRNALSLLGWASIGIVWSFLVAWGVTGNLIEKIIELMGTDSHELWWSQTLFYGFTSIVVAAMFSFMVETIQVLRNEFSGVRRLN